MKPTHPSSVSGSVRNEPFERVLREALRDEAGAARGELPRVGHDPRARGRTRARALEIASSTRSPATPRRSRSSRIRASPAPRAARAAARSVRTACRRRARARHRLDRGVALAGSDACARQPAVRAPPRCDRAGCSAVRASATRLDAAAARDAASAPGRDRAATPTSSPAASTARPAGRATGSPSSSIATRPRPASRSAVTTVGRPPTARRVRQTL